MRWLGIKRRFIEVAADRIDERPVCHACLNFGANELHHLTYATYGQERFIDLMLLCVSCHRLIHQIEHKMKCDRIAATKTVVELKRAESHDIVGLVTFADRPPTRIVGIESLRQRPYQLTKYDLERFNRPNALPPPLA
jgi:hypothetical protein